MRRRTTINGEYTPPSNKRRDARNGPDPATLRSRPVTGGRPGMISAATAATAVLMVTLVKEHGLEYLLAATILAGVLQVAAGLLKLGGVMRFVSRSVITGFVNALAILIFMAQLPELIGVPPLTYVMVAAGLGIIYGFPRITRAVPSPLICILVLTAISLALGLDLRTVSDMGELPDSLPIFLLPDVPGIANFCTGFIGGMAGCAMIGQSIINVKSGGRGRLSTFCAGIFLLLMIVFLGDWVGRIPMAALVAIMIMVSIGTFSWSSILNLREHPRSSSIVMLATVIVVVVTHNLALGVLTGVLFSGIFFAWKISQIFRVTSNLSDDKTTRTYVVEGQLFFASSDAFTASFDFREALERVVIDISRAHIWDISSVQALDMAVLKFRREGAEVELVGMNEASETIVDKLGTFDQPGALDRLSEH